MEPRGRDGREQRKLSDKDKEDGRDTELCATGMKRGRRVDQFLLQFCVLNKFSV